MSNDAIDALRAAGEDAWLKGRGLLSRDDQERLLKELGHHSYLVRKLAGVLGIAPPVSHEEIYEQVRRLKEGDKDDPQPKCNRCDSQPAGPGPCPYASEMHSDDTPCNCCDDCRYQCAMDV